ncbi:MAG: M12 family metallo-peptidase [Nitrosopumilaceae archaeon]
MGHKVIRYDLILLITIISVIVFSTTPNSLATHPPHVDDGTYTEDPAFLNPNPNPSPVTCTDTDSDKLCNSWELYSGIQIPVGTQIYTWGCGNYGPDGVCPQTNVRDIFVEIDYMEGHAPDSAAIQAVNSSFWNNGGVRLHIQVDQEIRENGTPYHQREISTPINTAPNTTFDVIKSDHFGELACILADNVVPYNDCLTAKKLGFHYAMFIHSQTGNPGLSGIAEYKGNDIIVSLGNFDNEVGSTAQQAGTFMHELGHNLGLQHGGKADDYNCKPNYLSVMNHAYQFSSTPNYGRNPTVSPIIQSPLAESTLNENIGINVGGQGRFITWNGGTYFVPPGTTAINWNGVNGYENPATNDLNLISSLGCDGTGDSLVASNDWGTAGLGLYYNFRANYNSYFLDGTALQVDSQNKTIVEPDLPEEEYIPEELTHEAFTNYLLERISSISGVLKSSKTQYSQASLEQKIKNNELGEALKDLKSLPQDDENIKYIVELLESATKHSDPITGNYDKYYNKDGILSGPSKQVSNGIPLTDEICKPSHRMVRLDKDKSKDTTSEAVCIKYSSLLTFIKLKKDFVVADNGICDGFFYQRQIYEENKSFFDDLDDASSADGAKLNCSNYFAQLDT